MIIEELVSLALEARSNSYSPYSGFSVGASLITKSGKIYTGCNIESAAFSPSLCAERVAFAKAVSEGEKNFEAIAVVGGKHGESLDFCAPCGVCRQVMEEFCKADFKIVLAKGVAEYKSFTLGELFPDGFGKNNLK